MNETRHEIPMATNIEQSRRLLACGVDLDSADMYWNHFIIQEPYLVIGEIPRDNETGEVMDNEDVPAWSLSALLAVLPQREIAPHGNTPCDLYIHHYPEFWLVMYHDGKTSGDAEDYTWQCASEQRAETLVEACVKMIEWLKL